MSKPLRVLVSWIGHADLNAFASSLEAKERVTFLGALEITRHNASAVGPIRTLLEHERFDEVHLLSNYPKRIARRFADALPCAVTLHEATLDDPTDYAAVYGVSDEVLRSIASSHPHCELCIHLSPGTPAMAAIWVLLGKSRYPATFFQTHKGRAWRTEIPFDLMVDFLPAALRDPDVQLQHLAAHAPYEVQGFEDIVGKSRAIRIAVGKAQRAAVRDVSVLIIGESGTGKEMFARAIHNSSGRKKGPFVALNCAALPRDLLESELFGHKKGAFTGAVADRAGAFKEANGGTLFLDEVAECPPDVQSKLLRVLQPPPGEGPSSRVFRRIGDSKDYRSDVRLLSASNRSLQAEIASGGFRDDLYYRLATITLALPALRNRPDDIVPLARTLLRSINNEFRRQEPGYKDKSISVGAIGFVSRYSWPGNVRQLYNALVQAAVMAQGDTVTQQDLEDAIGDTEVFQATGFADEPLGDGFILQKHLESIQRHYLQRAMRDAAGMKTKAAALLGIANYQTLDAQLKRLKVQ